MEGEQETMTLDDAIAYYDEVAEKCRRKANIERNDYMDLKDNASEAEQLADWLNELKLLRDRIEIQHGPCEDAVNKIKNASFTGSDGLDYVETLVALEALKLANRSFAQPEIKPIDYQDCANAMLRMWMDKVVTDGEYNRIMDKLNAFWGTRNEQHD